MKVLILEDDKKIGDFITGGLKQAGYTVDWFQNGKKGYEHLLNDPFYDLLILDLMLPEMSGEEIIRHLRDQGFSFPILVLSAKRSVEDRVSGLQLGADDYLIKPFAFAELQARTQAILRRRHKMEIETHLEKHGVSMDLLSRQVLRQNTEIHLQAKEFSLLEYFIKHPGQVISKTMILENVYDYSFDPQSNIVDVLVCRLRNKVDRDFEPKLIHTIRGLGYAFKVKT